MSASNHLNFCGGPGALPEIVLQQAQQSVIAVPEVGLSILGISHRSDWFATVVAELETNIRTLLELPDDYQVLFLQGGATQQFAMIPMNLLRGKRLAAEYLHTGYWSGKSLPKPNAKAHFACSGAASRAVFGGYPAMPNLLIRPMRLICTTSPMNP